MEPEKTSKEATLPKYNRNGEEIKYLEGAQEQFALNQKRKKEDPSYVEGLVVDTFPEWIPIFARMLP